MPMGGGGVSLRTISYSESVIMPMGGGGVSMRTISYSGSVVISN